MPKLWPGFGHRPAVFLMRCKKGIESNLSQCDDHAEAFKQFKLFNEVRPAAFEFNPARLVLRRRAPDRRSNITISEFQTVVSMNRLWLISKSRSMQRSVEPVAAAISRNILPVRLPPCAAGAKPTINSLASRSPKPAKGRAQ